MKHLLILFFLFSVGIAHGQIATSVGPGQDLFQRNLYSADKVMGMREELDLTDAQVANIKKAYSKNAGEFSNIKWDLDEATAKLKNLLDSPKIDQVAVQKQMDAVLKLENQLKKMQLDNLVAIKNELTEEQQKILQKNNVFIIKGIGSVNGVRGYSTTSDAATSLKSSKIRVGQPNYAMTWDGDKVSSGQVATGPGVSVYVAGSQNNGDKPLYYLDMKEGMIQINDFDGIKPESIESIQVLKDKKAIEKFGEKAKNGVIILKLKSGSK
ncbi:periplasmic heavy metal sensor [Algoriphagus sp. SE2]|uniref:Spy/CpxP family protein refolding chaperone n=1 Tax=Algoriphagus sp. SE2 TaxID=3141536 RepID=UPI0031CD49AC